MWSGSCRGPFLRYSSGGTPSRGLEVERTVILSVVVVVCDARCRWDPGRSLGPRWDPESSTLDCAEQSGSTVEHPSSLYTSLVRGARSSGQWRGESLSRPFRVASHAGRAWSVPPTGRRTGAGHTFA